MQRRLPTTCGRPDLPRMHPSCGQTPICVPRVRWVVDHGQHRAAQRLGAAKTPGVRAARHPSRRNPSRRRSARSGTTAWMPAAWARVLLMRGATDLRVDRVSPNCRGRAGQRDTIVQPTRLPACFADAGYVFLRKAPSHASANALRLTERGHARLRSGVAAAGDAFRAWTELRSASCESSSTFCCRRSLY